MPDPVAAGYRARDGSEHRVIVRRMPADRWHVLDTAASTTVVDTLNASDDGAAQAQALAHDYAAEQQAFQLGLRDDPLPRPRRTCAATTAGRAA